MTERAIFDAALEISDPQARRDFLNEACQGDQELRARVDALLRAFESAGEFLQLPALEQLQTHETGATEMLQPYGASEVPRHEFPGDAQRLPPGNGDLPPAQVDRKATTHEDNSPSATAHDEDVTTVVSLLKPSTKPGSIGRFAHYEVLEVLGQGGFGTVLKAFDEQLHRVVAIKVLDPQMASTSPPRKRFLREARAAAAINHENVVLVFGVGETPLPYLVMEYVEGRTLQQKMEEQGPLSLPEALQIARQVASGLAAAHATGLIHRDIKPSNILLDSSVQQRVKITDFGLARAADDASLTRTGVISGTPMYMAPEQACGGLLDHRADLFSFGSVLYQMLCGRPPFRASTTLAVLRRVAEDTPRPIREICPEVPSWMTDVVEKLHAKAPENRFQSAREVADLLAGLQPKVASLVDNAARLPLAPASANPASPAPQPLPAALPQSAAAAPAQVSASNRFSAGMVALAVLAIVAIVIVIGEQTGVTRFIRKAETTPLAPASPVVDAASTLVREKEAGSAPTPAAPPVASPATPPVASSELDSLRRVSADRLAAPLPATVEVVGVFGKPGIDWGGGIIEGLPSRDGTWWAARGEDGVTHVWDREGRLVNRFVNEIEWLRGVTADGLLMTLADRRLGFRDVKSGDVRFEIPVDISYLSPIPDQIASSAAPVLSTDGLFVAIPHDQGVVTIWDARTGTKLHTVQTGDQRPRALALGAQGRRLITGDSEGNIQFWETDSGKSGELRKTHRGAVTALALSPDGSQVASGGADRAIYLASTAADSSPMEPLEVLSDRVLDIAHLEFSPDGRRLTACPRSYDKWQQGVRVWNASTRTAESLGDAPLLCGARGAFARATFSTDGGTLTTAGFPGEPCISIREIGSNSPPPPLPRLEEPTRSVKLSADGRRLALSTDRGVTVWDTLENKTLFTHEHAKRPDYLPDSLDMNSAGAHVVFRSSEEGGNWFLGDVATGALRPLEKSEGCEQRIAFSRDGRYLAGVGTQAIALWDATTRRITHRATWKELGQESHIGDSIVLLRDNRTALVGCTSFRILQVDLVDRRVVRTFTVGENVPRDFKVQSLSVSADERLVAAACTHPFAPVVHAWNIATGEQAWEYSSRSFGLEGAYHVQFSADGLTMAVANRGSVELLDANSGRLIESQRLGPPDQGTWGTSRILGTSFTADGRYYASANGCGGAYLVRIR